MFCKAGSIFGSLKDFSQSVCTSRIFRLTILTRRPPDNDVTLGGSGTIPGKGNHSGLGKADQALDD
jgi:hypothetical protein